MTDDIQQKFDNYISAYTNLNNDDKRKEIINKLKNIIANLMKVNDSLGRNHDLLMNKELVDLNQDNVSEKDFLEGLFVYINTMEDEFFDLLYFLINKDEK